MLLYRLSVSDAAFEVRIIFKKTLQKYKLFLLLGKKSEKIFLFECNCLKISEKNFF